ncbi:hypothetical protein DRW07_11760 [Alteromonas sediminis]|uniref:DUF6671 domain-containing protein n=1 Tax=Alteromonas sediminis TaxID=2259342 RepID=A0A3N5YC27_9ALTE|nr:DUF6671 family protein [Alteromonas sediminis]RPJ66745.1 hypothetical protein DRW07_11760 [Alteromonas sediminis]
MPSAVLLTRHCKAKWIAPALLPVGFQVVEYTDFDTDKLGTFSGEVVREKDARATAAYKAKLACELSKSRYGLGSEGSFFPHPLAQITWEQEIICLFDAQKGALFYGMSEGPAEVTTQTIETAQALDDLDAFLGAEQRWMWQDVSGNWHKGLNIELVAELYKEHSVSYPQALVPDYRAMYCPSRQKMLEKAATDLANRLLSTCPQCGTPEFVYEKPQSGLPCSACSLPTTQAKGWWAQCKACGFKDLKHHSSQHTDPVNCAFCNP